jgi:hypothetical protein
VTLYSSSACMALPLKLNATVRVSVPVAVLPVVVTVIFPAFAPEHGLVILPYESTDCGPESSEPNIRLGMPVVEERRFVISSPEQTKATPRLNSEVLP